MECSPLQCPIELQKVIPFLATVLLSYGFISTTVFSILTGTFALKKNMPCFMVWSVAIGQLLLLV